MPEKTEPATVGRPSKFKPEYVEQARKLTQLGATDREVAEFFNVSEQTLNTWKHVHPEFLVSLKLGKETADRRVEQSLYRRAVGYSYDAEKIFTYEGQPVRVPYVEHVPPDTTACIFWLRTAAGTCGAIASTSLDFIGRLRMRDRVECYRDSVGVDLRILESPRAWRALAETTLPAPLTHRRGRRPLPWMTG